MTAPGSVEPLWIVVPAYNEEAGIRATLTALASQTDTGFALAVVDNASTDATANIVRRFAATAPFPVHLVHEEERGTGAAADTGFRYAVAHGAELLVRTDADCLPARRRLDRRGAQGVRPRDGDGLRPQPSAPRRGPLARRALPASGRGTSHRTVRALPHGAPTPLLPRALRAVSRAQPRHHRCAVPALRGHAPHPAGGTA
ncbi:glycosyltransferase family 2 protein [Streptomyces sp. NPDC087849]|uniref:glycosyltransferase family 2 protein n=1 Tax=Streptomyces sp. NPDC087849 TaxID=3365808 RepID=UPI00380FCA61